MIVRRWEHVGEWYRRRNDDNVYYVHYEELLSDPKGHIEKLASFLGVELTEDQVKQVIHSVFSFISQWPYRLYTIRRLVR